MKTIQEVELRQCRHCVINIPNDPSGRTTLNHSTNGVVVDSPGVKKLRVRVTQCPPSIQTNRMSRNKEHDFD